MDRFLKNCRGGYDPVPAACTLRKNHLNLGRTDTHTHGHWSFEAPGWNRRFAQQYNVIQWIKLAGMRFWAAWRNWEIEWFWGRIRVLQPRNRLQIVSRCKNNYLNALACFSGVAGARGGSELPKSSQIEPKWNKSQPRSGLGPEMSWFSDMHPTLSWTGEVS